MAEVVELAAKPPQEKGGGARGGVEMVRPREARRRGPRRSVKEKDAPSPASSATATAVAAPPRATRESPKPSSSQAPKTTKEPSAANISRKMTTRSRTVERSKRRRASGVSLSRAASRSIAQGRMARAIRVRAATTQKGTRHPRGE